MAVEQLELEDQIARLGPAVAGAEAAPGDKPTGKHSSGYSRLRHRHRLLIESHERLVKDYAALVAQHEELQLDAQRLLEQHERLMAAVQNGQPRVGIYR
jgi:hypothetical protein